MGKKEILNNKYSKDIKKLIDSTILTNNYSKPISYLSLLSAKSKRFIEEDGVDYSLITTHIVDDENVLYLMVDEPIIYHMRDKCDIVEDESGREYRIIDHNQTNDIYDERVHLWWVRTYPGINPKNTVYLGDIESYKEDSKFKGAVIGNPTKNKL